MSVGYQYICCIQHATVIRSAPVSSQRTLTRSRQISEDDAVDLTTNRSRELSLPDSVVSTPMGQVTTAAGGACHIASNQGANVPRVEQGGDTWLVVHKLRAGQGAEAGRPAARGMPIG